MLKQEQTLLKNCISVFLVDRSSERIVMIGSTQGGMEIEKLAETNPEAIKKIYVEPAVGLQDFQARTMGIFFGLRQYAHLLTQWR